MKYRLLRALTLILLLCLTSCLNFSSSGKTEKLSMEKDFQIVPVKNQYSIAIPNHMKSATDLNDEASLQYQNIFKEAYTVVIDEPRQELIDSFKELGEWDDSESVVENYKNIQLQFLMEEIEIEKITDSEINTINGLESRVVGFDGQVNGVLFPISYTLGFVEGEENVYMIMAWTLKNKKVKLKNTYRQIIESFKEI